MGSENVLGTLRNAVHDLAIHANLFMVKHMYNMIGMSAMQV